MAASRPCAAATSRTSSGDTLPPGSGIPSYRRIAAYHRETFDLLPPMRPSQWPFPDPSPRRPDPRCADARRPERAHTRPPGGPARAHRPPRLSLNDVSAAAWYLSSRTRARRFLVVTVSSGIGSKLFDRDHPAGVIDDPPYAGEIGHVVVDPGDDAPLCGCGGRGHLGAISSGRGTERLARERAAFPTLTNEEHLAPPPVAATPGPSTWSGLPPNHWPGPWSPSSLPAVWRKSSSSAASPSPSARRTSRSSAPSPSTPASTPSSNPASGP